MKIKYLFLGMAIQAFIAGLSDLSGFITISAGQQLGAGILFILVFALLKGRDNPKN
jgi:hypothetical protein